MTPRDGLGWTCPPHICHESFLKLTDADPLRLRQLRDEDSLETLRQLVTSLVLSRIDYCNVVLAGLTASTIAPLWRVQNAAAHLVLRLDHLSHVTSALRELH